MLELFNLSGLNFVHLVKRKRKPRDSIAREVKVIAKRKELQILDLTYQHSAAEKGNFIYRIIGRKSRSFFFFNYNPL